MIHSRVKIDPVRGLMNKKTVSKRGAVFILFIAFFLSLFSLTFIFGNNANAYLESSVSDCPTYRGPFRGDMPNGWNVPSNIYFSLNRADCNSFSPTVLFYVTTAASSTSSSITIPAGTTSVELAFRGAATVGWTPSSALLTRYSVVGASSGVSGIVGEFAQTDLSGGPNTRGWTSLSAPNTFTFAPPGGFPASGIYSGSLTVRVAQTFNNRGPACVANGASTSSIVGANCPNSIVVFNINVTVTPPPDVCNNLPGNQATIPPGYVSDGAGGCIIPNSPQEELSTLLVREVRSRLPWPHPTQMAVM